MILLIVLVLNLSCLTNVWAYIGPRTCERLRGLGYPCVEHSIITADNFKLTVCRIKKPDNITRPAVLMQHGLSGSSDSFIINYKDENSLALELYKQGYDIWLANFRGNDYSQEGIVAWNFCWHEMGIYDAPAIIDYILAKTKQTAIHLVGHSQGGTVFFVMASMRPEYMKKLKTIHMMAPAVILIEVKSIIAYILGKLSSFPNSLLTLMTNKKIDTELIHTLTAPICQTEPIPEWCANMLLSMLGGPSNCTNKDCLRAFYETNPSDMAARQLYHFGQLMATKQFQQFDYGPFLNLMNYGSLTTRLYPLQNIPSTHTIYVYGAKSDDLVSIPGLKKLSCTVSASMLHVIPEPQFKHADFMIGRNLNVTLNNCIINKMNAVEGKVTKTGQCNFEIFQCNQS